MLGTAAGTFGGMLGAQLVGGAIRGVTQLGGAVLGMGADAVSAGANFEASMDGIAAVLGGTSEDAEQLGQFIMDLGMNPNLKVSVAEAAQAVEILATQGVSLQGIMGGVAEGTVMLANATGGDFAASANVATDAMNLFGMGAEDVSDIVNGATGVINQSKFDINDYAYALANGGAAAAQFGVPLEDFNTVIAGTANSFVRGQTAGTAFSTMLTRLVPASGPAAEAMAELGWITADGANQFFDATGQMKDMDEIVGMLSRDLGTLTDEQKINYATQIFGTQGMDTALSLSKMTVAQYNELKTAISDTDAFESAKVRTDNLTSAWETLGDVWQGAKISFGAGVQEPLKDIVRTVTPVIQMLAPTIQWAGESIGAAVQGFVDSTIEPIVALVPVTIEAYNAAGGGEAGMRAALSTFLAGLPQTTVGDTIYQLTFAVAASWEVFNKSGSYMDAVQSFIGQSLGGKVVLNLDDSISFSLPMNGPGSLDFALKKTIDEQGVKTIEVGEIGFNFRTGNAMVGGVDVKSWWAAIGMDALLPWDKGTQGVIDAGPIRLDFRADGGKAISLNGLSVGEWLSQTSSTFAQTLSAAGDMMFGTTPLTPVIAVAPKFTGSPAAMGFDAYMQGITKQQAFTVTPTVTVYPKFVEAVGGEQAAAEIQTLLDFMAEGDTGIAPIEPIVPVSPRFQIVPSADTLTAAIRNASAIGATGAVGGGMGMGMGMTVPVQAEVKNLSPGNVTLDHVYDANAAIKDVIDWGTFYNPSPYGSGAKIDGVTDWGNYTHEYSATVRITEVIDGSAGGGGGDAGQTGLGGGRASGSLSTPEGYSWVGERGPELVRLPGASRVWSNQDSMAMAGAGGPQIIVNASINSPMDEESLIRRLKRELRRGF